MRKRTKAHRKLARWVEGKKSVTEAARQLGISRQRLDGILTMDCMPRYDVIVRVEKVAGIPAAEWL